MFVGPPELRDSACWLCLDMLDKGGASHHQEAASRVSLPRERWPRESSKERFEVKSNSFLEVCATSMAQRSEFMWSKSKMLSIPVGTPECFKNSCKDLKIGAQSHFLGDVTRAPACTNQETFMQSREMEAILNS